MRVVKLAGFVAIGLAFASSGVMAGDFTCPAAAQAAMDAEFLSTVDGVPTSAITQCLGVRKSIKIAVNVSAKDINGKNGILQQINNVKNMVDNYEKVYGITQGAGYDIAVIAHGSAGKYMLDSAVYDSKYPGDIGGNAKTVEAINYLLSRGVKVFMCQNTMHSNQFVTADLIPGLREVPSGVTAVIDYGMREYVVITP